MNELPNLHALTLRFEALETVELAGAASWRYADALGILDFQLSAAVFTEDAALATSRGTRQYREEVVPYYQSACANPIKRKHSLACVHTDSRAKLAHP